MPKPPLFAPPDVFDPGFSSGRAVLHILCIITGAKVLWRHGVAARPCTAGKAWVEHKTPRKKKEKKNEHRGRRWLECLHFQTPPSLVGPPANTLLSVVVCSHCRWTPCARRWRGAGRTTSGASSPTVPRRRLRSTRRCLRTRYYTSEILYGVLEYIFIPLKKIKK